MFDLKKLSTLVLILFVQGAFADSDIVSIEDLPGCPKKIELNADLIEKNIKHYIEQKELWAAALIASNCATYGSSMDVSIISKIAEAYDVSLQKTMTKDQYKSLTSMSAKCWQKYAGPDNGTMGSSQAAHCSLKVYQAFDSIYSD